MKKVFTLLFALSCFIPLAHTQTQPQKTPEAKPKQVKSTSSPKSKPATSQAKPSTPAPRPTPPPAPVQPTPPPAPKPAPQSAPQAQAQPAPQPVSQSKIESVWIGGSVGGGLALSTNIVNSGAVFPMNLELLFQTRHHRCGIGFANEVYVTPESLGRLVLGEAPIVKKLYFGYEAFIFRNFPINLGFSSHIGFFGTSGSHTMQDKGKVDTATARGGIFGNVGVVLELGARPFYFFIRPAIEYKSWSSFHKEIIATGSVGIRLKFLTDYEIKRRADKKRDRDNKF